MFWFLFPTNLIYPCDEIISTDQAIFLFIHDNYYYSIWLDAKFVTAN